MKNKPNNKVDEMIKEVMDNWNFVDSNAKDLKASLESVAQTAKAESRLECYEIIHQYAIQTKDTALLDCLEAIQKDILT